VRQHDHAAVVADRLCAHLDARAPIELIRCQGRWSSARERSRDLPVDGHEFCPVDDRGLAQCRPSSTRVHQFNGLTPWPARA